MEKVKNMNFVVNNIHNVDGDFYQQINGAFYKLDIITILNMKLIDLIAMIKNNQLYSTHYDY